MKGFFKIQNKLFIIAFVVALILGLSWFFAQFYSQKHENLTNYSGRIDKLRNTVLQIHDAERDFLLKEVSNYHFYESGESRYLSRFDKFYEQALTQLDVLERNTYSEQYAVSENLKDLQSDFELYSKTLYELVAFIRERGLENYGLWGDLNTASLQIAQLLHEKSSLSNYDYFVTKLENTSNDFLFKNDLGAPIRLNRVIEEFKMQLFREDSLAENILLDDQRALLKVSIDNYQTKFEKLAEIQNTIGLTAEAGLKGEGSNVLGGIYNKLDEITVIVRQKNEFQFDRYKNIMLIINLLLLSLILSLFIWVSRSINLPVKKMQSFVHELVQGKLPEPLLINSKDEIAQIVSLLNNFVANLKTKLDFSDEIKKGNLAIEFTPISDKDLLGNALLEMQQSLKKASQEHEQLKIDEKKQNWQTLGIAKFNDILRRGGDNIEELADEILSNLVEYLHANQGGIFSYNDEEKTDIHLLMVASYAYNTKKFVEKKILPGEGLVGTCALERKTIYLTKIPESYIEITSGLGDSNPRSLLIVPLKVEHKLLGIIEIASFNQFEAHEISLVEQIAENIASTFETVRINERTAFLLEQSQRQSEELSTQEIEMRQNLEELNNLQKEAALKDAKTQSLINSFDSALVRADFDLEGNLVSANPSFLESFSYNFFEIEGKHISMFFYKNIWFSFKRKWEKIVSGKLNFRDAINFKTKIGSNWLLTTYVLKKDASGQPTGLLLFALDIQESKKEEIKIKKNIDKLEEQSEILQAQNEEMQQNLQSLSKLKANQEEKEKELLRIIDGLKDDNFKQQIDLERVRFKVSVTAKRQELKIRKELAEYRKDLEKKEATLFKELDEKEILIYELQKELKKLKASE